MYNPFSLEGKTILVTGASSGIGRQCAIDCSKMGATVILIARNAGRLADTHSLLEGESHKLYQYDLLDIDGISALMDKIIKECGKVDGLVHAAGIERTLPMKFIKPKDWEEVYRVNCMAGFELARLLGQKKYNNGSGRIVFVSSITAIVGRKGVAAYAASKGALISTVKTIALEYANKGITVNCISPGTVLTPMMESYLSALSEDEREKRLDGFPLGIGQPADISNACIYLLSDASRWITGQNLVVDGGYTIK